MIEQIEFTNFKVLRDAKLPLSAFTLLVGPNGSGKTTALRAFEFAARSGNYTGQQLCSVGAQPPVRVSFRWGPPDNGRVFTGIWNHEAAGGTIQEQRHGLQAQLRAVRIFNLDANRIASPVPITPEIQLGHDGSNLAGVIERLRDSHPERFEALTGELGRLLPEFDKILFQIPAGGQKAFQLRTRKGGHSISAPDLSQGTLFAVAMLTLGYLPTPPPLIAVEEPNRGIHPRLLRDIHDTLYRLSHPAEFGDDRDAVQVIATTHSPYMLDLFRDHPEDVVIASKQGNSAAFERLTDQKDIEKILGDSHLGDAWYTGILGGVPL